jgi:hypothetical protein
MTARQYDQMMVELDLDADPPAGMIVHLAAEGGTEGIVGCDVWQTPETFQAFLERRLRPALRQQRFRDDPSVRIVPLHNLFAADVGTIERIGAVSVPALVW